MTIFQNVIIFFPAIATFSELQPHNLVRLFYISRCDFISLSYNFGSRNLLIYTLYIPQSEFKSRNVALFFLLYRFFPLELLLYLTIWRYISQFCFISCSVHLFFIKKKNSQFAHLCLPWWLHIPKYIIVTISHYHDFIFCKCDDILQCDCISLF